MLAGGVARHVNAALERKHRSNVDDFAGALLNHMLAGQLAQHVYGIQIHIEHILPILVAMLSRRRSANNARIIYEHINTAQLTYRTLNNCRQLRAVANIGLNRDGFAP
ncbi:hypothetical protein D3C78_1450150 [compost metagenome]